MTKTIRCLACISLVVTFISAGLVRAADPKKGKVTDQRQELEKLKRDVQKSQSRLDSLKREEARVQKDLSEYDQRITSQRQVLDRLKRERTQLSRAIGEAENQQKSSQQNLEQTQRRFLANVRQLYVSARQTDYSFLARPDEEREMHRRLIYLTQLANFESGSVTSASQSLSQSLAELKQLIGEGSQMSGLVKQKEASYALEKSRKQRREKALDRIRRLSKDEAERVISLSKVAEEMESIIARLEKQQREAQARRQTQPRSSSSFAGLKGNLATPFKGTVLTSFGHSVDPVTRLKSFSPGIVIKGAPKGAMHSVAAGTVVYTGNLRGYGNFVIVDHDGEYYTTYAGLGGITVESNQEVRAGQQLGQAGGDGIVRFELRKGREPLDPVEWLTIESF
ncbi:MAG: peptidoglycan DD-metalloendopeptidase family protein [Candidatus Zixiibacteriota bacterium]